MEDIDVNSVDRKRNVALKRFLSGTSSTQEPRYSCLKFFSAIEL